ncbi:MAG TPA: hypothetical protein VFA43_03620 [Gemmatimonadaceae bacterium]|nr:hypothetical protein [Gemmatimonadaceae bacterium]
MKNVLVALYSYRSYKYYGTPPMEVVKVMGEAVEMVATEIALRQDIETTNPFHGIFMAPEYCFVGRRSTLTRGAMSAKRKNEVIAGLTGISKAHPKILIIAGSILWRDEIDTADKQLQFKANVLAAAMKATNFGKTDNQVRLKGHQAQDGRVIPGLDDLVAGTPTYRAYNEVYGFLNGEMAFKPYKKECDYFETDGAKAADLAYVPGSAGGMREVGKFDLGIEICADHAYNTLKGKKADLHILVSDSVKTKPNQCIGGYLLHASSNSKETGVWKSGDTNRLAAIGGAVPFADVITTWMVPIEARP